MPQSRRTVQVYAAWWGVWASYYSLAGYLGGTAFSDNPWIGIAVGLGIAVGVGIALNVGRLVWVRFARRTSDQDDRTAPDLMVEGGPELG